MGIENERVIAHFVEKRETLSIIFSFSFLFSFFFWGGGMCMLTAILQTISDGCSNAISVIFNENIIFFGHDSKFKSDNTFDLTILRAFFFNLQVQNDQEHTTFVSVQTCFGSRPTESKFSMSQDKLVTDWLFFLSQNANRKLRLCVIHDADKIIQCRVHVHAHYTYAHTNIHTHTNSHTQTQTQSHTHMHTPFAYGIY